MKTLKVKRLSTFRVFLEERDNRVNLLYGGAGSGKSYSIAQLFIRRLYEEEDIRMLVLRKTLPALRITAYRLVLDILKEYELSFELNKSEMIIKVGSNEILFKSLDDPEKIKSYEANYLWIEEATEVSYEDFIQLNLRLRRKNKDNINQMYLTFNPISRFHWLNMQLIESTREDIAIHHSTYKDNPFLTAEYIAELEGLTDENFYKIYTQGEFGELRNVIYSNYVVEDISDILPEEIIYGIDFGWNNENAIIEIGIKDNEYYLTERLYATQLTNNDLIEKMNTIIKPSTTIYADSAEPARIEEIARTGFDIYAANKNVLDGIDYVKSHKLHIDRNSINLINEIRAYKYREDRNGVVKEEPVKFRDHLMDALRYGTYTHSKSQNKESKAPNYYIPTLQTQRGGYHL
jgi:phage terminase large subunit